MKKSTPKKGAVLSNAGRKAGQRAPLSSNIIKPGRMMAFRLARFNPIRRLTPELLAYHLDSFEVGYLRYAALIWDAMENRDGTLSSVVPKRKKGPGRYGYEILTTEDSPAAQEQKEALEYLYGHITAKDALDGNKHGNFKMLLRQMMDAIGKRYAVHEIIWRPDPKGLTAELRFVPLWFFENRTGNLRFLESEGALYGIPLEEEGWMITVGDGLMVASSIAYMFKGLSLKDWVAYSERLGTPGVIGKTDSVPGSPAWDNMKRAVESFGVDFAAVMNKTDELTIADLKGAGVLPFPALVEKFDTEMATTWRGSDLGTHSKKNATGASLQADETEIFNEDDAELLQETCNYYLSRPALKFQFGTDEPLAYLKIKGPTKKDTKQDLLIDAFLVENGAPVSQADALERYGRTMPSPTEPLLKPPAAPPVNDEQIPGLTPANERRANPDDDAFEKNIAASINKAELMALTPVTERLNTILSGPDEMIEPGLKKLLNDLPDIAKKAGASPACFNAWNQALSTALVNGLTEPAPKLPKAKKK